MAEMSATKCHVSLEVEQRRKVREKRGVVVNENGRGPSQSVRNHGAACVCMGQWRKGS